MKSFIKLTLLALICLVFLTGQSLAKETYQFVTEWGTLGKEDGQFNGPRGIAVDVSGNVYVADSGNNRIQKFDSNGNFIATWGSLGNGHSQFKDPRGIAIDPAGNIYVSDTSNNRIQKFDSNSNFIVAWGKKGYENGEFWEPAGISVDQSGNVFVADTNLNRVQLFDSTGMFQNKWGKPNGQKGSKPGEFWLPNDMAFSLAKNVVYVADTFRNRIQIFDIHGVVLMLWGQYGAASGQFKFPAGIAVGPTSAQDKVFVADTENNRIQKFNYTGFFITAWGNKGSNKGEFMAPNDVAVDAAGYVYVADTGNNRVQKFKMIDLKMVDQDKVKESGIRTKLRERNKTIYPIKATTTTIKFDRKYRQGIDYETGRTTTTTLLPAQEPKLDQSPDNTLTPTSSSTTSTQMQFDYRRFR